MKSKLIFYVLLLHVGLLLPMEVNYPTYSIANWGRGLYEKAAQNLASLKDWVSAKTSESVKERASDAASFAHANRYKVAAGTVAGSTLLLNEMFKSGTLSQDTAQNLLWGAAGIALVATAVSQVYAWYNNDQITEKQAETTIEASLRKAIESDILYPTYQSKVDALTNKDEFLTVLQDTDGFFDKACEVIKQEFVARAKQQTEKEAERDKKIDRTIAVIEDSVKDRSTLQEKINALENAQGFAFVQAYMSYYLRLKNRLAVQNTIKTRGAQDEK